MYINISNHPAALDVIDGIINSGGVAEVKLEHNRRKLVVVEVNTFRSVKSSEEIKEENE